MPYPRSVWTVLLGILALLVIWGASPVPAYACGQPVPGCEAVAQAGHTPGPGAPKSHVPCAATHLCASPAVPFLATAHMTLLVSPPTALRHFLTPPTLHPGRQTRPDLPPPRRA